MKRTMIALIALGCLLTAGCAMLSQQSATTPEPIIKEANVSGYVTDTEGNALISQVILSNDQVRIRINTDLLGHFSAQLPLGEYSLELTKGSEYERKTEHISVLDRKAKDLGGLVLRRLYDTGYIAGDLHQHSIYSFDGTNNPAEILLSDLAAGLGFGIITDHNDIRAFNEFQSAQIDGFVPISGIEITTDRGHFNAINFHALVDTDISDGVKDIERIIQTVQEDADAILQINHPVRPEFQFEDWALVEQFDTIELWNGKSMPPYVAGSPNEQTLLKWYSLLNEGIYLPATAGSDNHDIGGNRMFATDSYASDDERWFTENMFSGSPRTYVFAEPDSASILSAITQGHSFLTNNPLVYLEIDGAIPGETVTAGELEIHIKLESNRALSEFSLVKNGKVLRSEAISGMTAELIFTETLSAGDWIVLTVCGENGDYAITNPVFIK